MTPRWAVALGAPALAELKTRWRGALVVVALAFLALALLLPAGSLAGHGSGGQPALSLPEVPAADLPLGPSADPSATQARSLAELLGLLSALAWIGFGVATCSIFATRAAQASERAQETGIRRAVGASRTQILLSLLGETALLAAIALIAGLAFGQLLLTIARDLWPGVVAARLPIRPAAALAVCAVLGAAGLASLGLFRPRQLTGPPELPVSLRIPTVQVAVSVALLLGSAALLSGRAANPRFGAAAAGSSTVVSVDSGLSEPEVRSTRYAALLSDLLAQRDTEAVSLTSGGELLGLGTIGEVTTDCGRCVFGQIEIRWPHFGAVAHAVSADSFHTQGSQLLEGRAFEPGDRLGAPRVAIVNHFLARRYFHRGEAVGRDIYLGPGWPGTPYRVIAIVDDEPSAAIGGPQQPREALYLSVLQHPPRRFDLLVQSNAPLLQQRLLDTLHRTLGAQVTLLGRTTALEYFGRQLRAGRWFGAGFAIAALMILVLALLGTLTTAKLWADSMAWELALRRAVGARRRTLARFVLKETAVIGVGGALLGCVIYGMVLAPALAGSLQQPAVPPAALVLRVILVSCLLALLAAALPALHSVRHPPSNLLR